jgi:putative flavoprotein involved in K+ transport
MADLKLNRLLGVFDDWSEQAQRGTEVDAEARPEKTRVAVRPPLALDLAKENIRTVLWATGLTPDLRWLELPVFDRRRRLQHDGGIVGAPGVYVLGLPFMRRRKSSYMHGAEDDARDLSSHIEAHLDAIPASGRYRRPSARVRMGRGRKSREQGRAAQQHAAETVVR